MRFRLEVIANKNGTPSCGGYMLHHWKEAHLKGQAGLGDHRLENAFYPSVH